MAYSRYATELKDNDNNIYGIMDEEARAVQEQGEKIFHELMSVGTADALRSEKYLEDKVPYNFRKAICASKRAEEMLVGGTVAWNQLAKELNSTYWNFFRSSGSFSDGVVTFTATQQNGSVYGSQGRFNTVANHVYMALAMVKLTTGNTSVDLNFKSDTLNMGRKYTVSTTDFQALSLIVKPSSSTSDAYCVVEDARSSGWDAVQVKNIMLFDLTAMFGSTIADAIYAMEQATAGSGVAWFRNLFPKDYYAYDAGSLQSVQAGSKVTTGFNLWDGTYTPNKLVDSNSPGSLVDNTTGNFGATDYIPVIGGKDYYLNIHRLNSGGYGMAWYDGNKTYLSGVAFSGSMEDYVGVLTAPKNACYMRTSIHIAYINETCINMSSDKNGQYGKYIPPHTYPFDSDLVLRGVPKWNSGSGKMYYDGDEYTADGKVTRKYGIVDLSTLDWSSASNDRWSALLNTTKITDHNIAANAICSTLEVRSINSFVNAGDGNGIGINNAHGIYARNGSTTNPPTGYLVYELATPTTEQADSFGNPMICDPDGTEEFVEWGTRDVAVPVGHITHYLEDLSPVLNNIPVIHDNQTNQAVASFSDGAEGLPIKQMQIGVEPVQDLHGYDHPWPAGGGKNLLDTESKSEDVNGLTVTYNYDSAGNLISVKINGTQSSGNGTIRFSTRTDSKALVLPVGNYIYSVGNALPSGVSISVGRNSEASGGSYVALGNQAYDNLPFTVDYAYALTVQMIVSAGTTLNNFMIYPMIRLASVSDATFAPYSNICPITGWTGAKVNRTGFNIWDEVYEQGQIDSSSGQNISGTNIRSKNYIPCVPNTEYYFKSSSVGGGAFLFYYNENKEYLSGGVSVARNTVFTTPANAYYMRFFEGASYGTTYNNDISINYPSSDTAYHAYAGQEYQITFPSEAGTVYGGTLTVNKDGTGTLVVDRAGCLLKDQTITQRSTKTSGIYRYAFTPNPATKLDPSPHDVVITVKSNVLIGATAFRSYVDRIENCVTGDSENNRINFFASDKQSVSAWQQFAEDNNVQIVYELATPVTYALTALQIRTLLGLNNVWADTGDILSVDYPADTKLYINKQIAINARLLEMIITANHEEAMKATKAYSADDLLIVNGKLYKASTSIANGATLTVGTNVTATTVAAEIAALA